MAEFKVFVAKTISLFNEMAIEASSPEEAEKLALIAASTSNDFIESNTAYKVEAVNPPSVSGPDAA
jgi:hypothetical protein